jgi:hypothetical protein
MATTYNDKIFGQKVLQQLNDLLLPLRAFSLDISDELKTEGDAVVIPLYGNVATTTFTQAAGVMEQSGGSVTAVTVTLDKRRITPVDLTHQQLLESSALRPDRFTGQMAKSIAKTILLDVMSTITTVNFGAAVITTNSAGYGRPQLIAARQALLDAGVDTEMSFVSNRLIESALLGDDKLTLALNRGDSSAIKEGYLGRLIGLDLYASSIFPTNAISLTGFACGRDAIAFASRRIGDVLPNQEYDAVETFTDDETGLSLLYTRHWSRASGKWHMNMHALYGFSAAVTKALRVFTTATT